MNPLPDFSEIVGSEILRKKLNKMNKLQKVWNWLIKSSANPEKYSLTLKGGIPLLVLWGVGDTETLTALTGAVGNFLVLLGQVVAAIFTVRGLLRKLWYTYQ